MTMFGGRVCASKLSIHLRVKPNRKRSGMVVSDAITNTSSEEEKDDEEDDEDDEDDEEDEYISISFLWLSTKSSKPRNTMYMTTATNSAIMKKNHDWTTIYVLRFTL